MQDKNKNKLAGAALLREARQTNEPIQYQIAREQSAINQAFEEEQLELRRYNGWVERPAPRQMSMKDLEKIMDKDVRDRNNAQRAGRG